MDTTSIYVTASSDYVEIPFLLRSVTSGRDVIYAGVCLTRTAATHLIKVGMNFGYSASIS